MNRNAKVLQCQPYYAAILAAPPVWLGLCLLARPDIDISWPMQLPWTFMLLVVLYPVLEELAFRGFIQGELMRRTVLKQQYMGMTLANILTSIVFAGAHLFSHSTGLAALVMLPSLVFGYFRDRYDGWLAPSIGLHIYYNLGYFLLFRPPM